MTQRRLSKAVGIGTASRLTDVEVHTLRYWEDEFGGLLDPIRTEGGQRRYRPEDIDLIQRIKGLLRDEMLTIPGARRRLVEEAQAA
jgi:DNA-binding transcriptional MerR regulator